MKATVGDTKMYCNLWMQTILYDITKTESRAANWHTDVKTLRP